MDSQADGNDLPEAGFARIRRAKFLQAEPRIDGGLPLFACGNRRAGTTLLELILATTLMTGMVTATAVVLRTGHVAWEANRADAALISAGNATARHVVRRVRQAEAVISISDPGDASGSLSVLMPSGETMVWSHDDTAGQVMYGVGSADSLLGQDISTLSFVGYRADGTTQTTVAAEIQSIKCRVSVELPRTSGGTRTVSCWAWLRAW